MTKVIYVSIGRLTDRVARDWYLNHLIENNVEVEYWDIVALVRKEHTEVGMQNPDYLHRFYKLKDVERRLKFSENRQAYYVIIISYSGRFANIFRLFSKYNCKMLFIAQGAIPIFIKKTTSKIANHFFHPLRLVNILTDRFIARFFRKFGLVKPFHTIFAVGSAMMNDDQYAEKMVPINLCDYDNFKAAETKNVRLMSEKYAVFLDINLAFHADLEICNMPAVDSNVYFGALNKFFSLLEEQYDVKVVIAAHPTSNYNSSTFQGRSIYRLSTPELVKDAEFVITHHSTSLSYAVLNLKPLIFVYTQEMLALHEETILRHIYAQASYLNSEIYDIDKITSGEQIEIKSIDKNRYEKYKYEFLTSPESEHTLSKDIFLRALLYKSDINT